MAKAKKEEEITNKITCTCCGQTYRDTEFYESNSYMFKDLGKSVICKKCLDGFYKIQLFTYNNDEIKAMYSFCQLMNIPFLRGVYNGVCTQLSNSNKTTSPHRVYMQKYNSMWKTNECPVGFLNGDGIDEKIDVESEKKNLAVDLELNQGTVQVTQTDMKFWGSRYSKSDVQFLKSRYNQWITYHKSDELAEQVLFKQIAIIELEIEQDRDNKKDPMKKIQALQELMKSVNVKPSEQKAYNANENLNALGLWTKDIERYRPAEYFQDKKLYEDHDGLVDYIKRFFVRPLKNLLTGSRDFDKEFNLVTDDSNSINNNMDDDFDEG